MKQLPCFLALALLAVVPCRAAVSILVQPGATPDTSIFTITQTSPGPVTGISGVSGYSLGISLPTAMFNIPGLDPESSSDIFGDLTSPVGTVTEVFSGELFDLTKLRISANPALGSVLGFDRVFEFPIGASALQFEVGTLGPVETNVSLLALHQGTHVIEDTLLGTVTVTVIPEPAAALLLPLSASLAWRRRRGSV